MAKNKAFVEANHTQSKSFSYKKGGVTLSFSLRVDIKQEMKDFVELLERAVVEVGEEFAKKN